MLLGRLAWLFARVIKDPLVDMQLLLIGLGYEKSCEASEGEVHAYVDEHQSEQEQDEPGTFRFWRV